MLRRGPVQRGRAHAAEDSRWQSFWHITLPLLRSTIVVALIFRAIFTIKRRKSWED